MAMAMAGAPAPDRSARALADGLGWLSIGLGLGELLAPRALTRFLGMEAYAGLIQAYGAREITTGIGILSRDDPAPWLWGRVAGDALDLATLAAGLADDRARTGNVGLAMAAVAGVTVLDVICAQALSGDGQRPARHVADYRGRRGMPLPPQQMQGAARDAPVRRDMRIPEALRPYPAAAAPPGATPDQEHASRPANAERIATPHGSPTMTKPGDEAAPGTPGSGEDLCPVCHGSGQQNGQKCSNCAGSGKVIGGIGGG